MANPYRDIEERIQDALQELSEPAAPPVTKVAMKYDVPYKRLLAQYHSCPSKSTRSSYKPNA